MSSTVTWTTEQWGFSIGANWSQLAPDPANIVTLSGLVRAGMIFDATNHQTLRTATVGSQTLMLDPPLISAITFSGTFSRAPADGTDNILEVGLVPVAAAADYATGLTTVPWGRSEISLGTFSLTLPAFPTEVTLTGTVGTTAMAEIRAYVTSRSAWDGRLAISLRRVGTDSFRVHNYAGNLLSAVTTQDLFFNGLAGGPYGGRVRYVRDGRFAMPMLSTQVVRDGDQLGLYVRPEDFDPEDPENEYRPRSGEGTIRDDIPDI